QSRFKGRPSCEAQVFEKVLKTRIVAERVESWIGSYYRHFIRALSQAFIQPVKSSIFIPHLDVDDGEVRRWNVFRGGHSSQLFEDRQGVRSSSGNSVSISEPGQRHRYPHSSVS